MRMFEAYSICSSGVKMNCEVLPFCLTSPLTASRMNRFLWSGTHRAGPAFLLERIGYLLQHGEVGIPIF